MNFFLCVIGMVLIIEGLPYFISPSRMKSFIEKMLYLPEKLLRSFGFFLMLMGLLLVYLGKFL